MSRILLYWLFHDQPLLPYSLLYFIKYYIISCKYKSNHRDQLETILLNCQKRTTDSKLCWHCAMTRPGTDDIIRQLHICTQRTWPFQDLQSLNETSELSAKSFLSNSMVACLFLLYNHSWGIRKFAYVISRKKWYYSKQIQWYLGFVYDLWSII